MNLATQCSACGTVFRVVQDQLKVSDGWVRCGRCNAVFQASESLFDLERDALPGWAGAAPASPDAAAPADGTPTATAPAGEPDFEVTEPPSSAEATLRALSAAAAAAGAREAAGMTAAAKASPVAKTSGDAGQRGAGPSSSPAGPVHAARPARAGHDRGVDTGAGPNSDADADADTIVTTPAGAPMRPGGGGRSSRTEPSPSPAEAPAPAFVERAQREAFWHSGRMRAALGLTAVLLIALLGMQAAQQFSDVAAARWPALRPALTAWCGLTGCSLAAPHRIDAIVVENTALTPAEGGVALRLGVGLRNRAAHAVALPSVDLSLTDSGGRLIARRTLQPRDFGVVATEIAAHTELPLKVLLVADGAQVTGYTVEIFYP